MLLLLYALTNHSVDVVWLCLQQYLATDQLSFKFYFSFSSFRWFRWCAQCSGLRGIALQCDQKRMHRISTILFELAVGSTFSIF